MTLKQTLLNSSAPYRQRAGEPCSKVSAMVALAGRPRDPNGPHIRVYHSLINSHAWRVTGSSAKNLFIDLRVRLNASNNGNIAAVFSDLKHRGWRSKTTMHKALRELEALGFI